MKPRTELTQIQAMCWLQQWPGLQQPGPIHKALCPEGKVNNLFRGSPIPDKISPGDINDHNIGF